MTKKLLTNFAVLCGIIAIAAACCPSYIPWEICNFIPVEDAYTPETCDLDYVRSGIPCSTRFYLMRQALQLGLNAGGLCPFGDAFASIVVIHHGPNIADIEYVCTGVNNFGGNGWTAHGEIEALRNCSNVVKAKYGESYVTNSTFWHTLSLYTTAESCSMCMSAIRFATLKEVIFGTYIEQLHAYGWPQISLFNEDIQEASNTCNFGNDGTAMQTRVITGVVNNETDPYFAWQFNSTNACPTGCSRVGGFCSP